jgi:hypothetical protein
MIVAVPHRFDDHDMKRTIEVGDQACARSPSRRVLWSNVVETAWCVALPVGILQGLLSGFPVSNWPSCSFRPYVGPVRRRDA